MTSSKKENRKLVFRRSLLDSDGSFCFLTSVYFFTVLSFFESIQIHRNTKITMNARAIVDIAPIKIPFIKREDRFGGSVWISNEKSGKFRHRKPRESMVGLVIGSCLIHHQFLHEEEQQENPLMIYMACEFAGHKDPNYQ